MTRRPQRIYTSAELHERIEAERFRVPWITLLATMALSIAFMWVAMEVVKCSQ